MSKPDSLYDGFRVLFVKPSRVLCVSFFQIWKHSDSFTCVFSIPDLESVLYSRSPNFLGVKWHRKIHICPEPLLLGYHSLKLLYGLQILIDTHTQHAYMYTDRDIHTYTHPHNHTFTHTHIYIGTDSTHTIHTDTHYINTWGHTDIQRHSHTKIHTEGHNIHRNIHT